MSAGHTYRVTLIPIADSGAERAVWFTHRNHDDIASIVKKTAKSTGLQYQDAAALAVGLKLLSATVLEHRNDPLFSGIHAALGEFIRALKARHG